MALEILSIACPLDLGGADSRSRARKKAPGWTHRAIVRNSACPTEPTGEILGSGARDVERRMALG
jgi:hypothetical protein